MSRNRYKIAWHIRQFVKKELMDYKKNKKMYEKLKGNTRELLIIKKRLDAIENVLCRLDMNDYQAAKIIFIDQYTREGAEMLGLSKDAYYNAMNKIIYLTAKEMDLI